jgi:hypothetical protein
MIRAPNFKLRTYRFTANLWHFNDKPKSFAMSQTNANKNLHAAKNAKKDEFYTQLADIENELKHYRHHFKNKLVYCNCDDPRVSNFFHYFSYNFEDLGLKKLITTCYQNQHMNLLIDRLQDQVQCFELPLSGA